MTLPLVMESRLTILRCAENRRGEKYPGIAETPLLPAPRRHPGIVSIRNRCTPGNECGLIYHDSFAGKSLHHS
jgi:hypothetical protein